MSTTIPITLNLTYDQIKAFTTLGFPEAKEQLGAFSHKIHEIRRAIDHISSFRCYLMEHINEEHNGKLDIIYNQFVRLTKDPYDLIQQNEGLS